MKNKIFKKVLALLVVSVMLIGCFSTMMFVSAAETEVVFNDARDFSKIECGSGVSASDIYGAYGLTISHNTTNPTVAVCGAETDLSQYERITFMLQGIGYPFNGLSGVSVSADGEIWYTVNGLPDGAAWGANNYEIPVSELGSNITNVSKIYVRLNGTMIGDAIIVLHAVKLIAVQNDENTYEEFVYDWNVEEVASGGISSSSIGSNNMVSMTTIQYHNTVDITFKGKSVNLSQYDNVTIDFFSEGNNFVEFNYYLVTADGYAHYYETGEPQAQNWNIVTLTIPTSTLGSVTTDSFTIRLQGQGSWPRNIQIGNFKLHKSVQIVNDTTISNVGVSYGETAYDMAMQLGADTIDVELPYGVEAATITPTLLNKKASLTVDGNAVSAIDVSVAEGNVSKSIVVTSENGAVTKTYTLNVTAEDTSVHLGTLNAAIDGSTISCEQATVTADNGKFKIVTNANAGNIKVAIAVDDIDLSFAENFKFNLNTESGYPLSDWEHIEVYTNNSTTRFITEINNLFIGEGAWATRELVVPVSALGIESGVTNTIYFELVGNSIWSIPFFIGEINLYSDYMEKAIMDTFTVSLDGDEIDVGFNPYVKEQKFNLPSFVESVTLAGTALFDGSAIQTDLGDTALNLGDNVKEITVLAADGKSTTTYTINIRRRGARGDLNCDGKTGLSGDFVVLKKVLLGVDEIDLVESDVNNDGELNILDYICLAKGDYVDIED